MSLDLSNTATQLMKSLGDETYVKITRTTGSVFDPVAGTETGGTTSVIDAVGVVVRIDNSLIDGERIKATDKMILLGKGVTPLMTDLITFGGIDNKVIRIEEVNHAGITQLWKVITRG